MSHTPGVWGAVLDPKGVAAVLGGEDGSDILADVGRIDDARLMAAAPDLAEAAQYALWTITTAGEPSDTTREAIRLLCAAINKSGVEVAG